jgi:uncharacterized membrane protein YtjA (UPF0391 family)
VGDQSVGHRGGRRGTGTKLAIIGGVQRRMPHRVKWAVSAARAKEMVMLQMAAVFFVIAIIAAVFGFGGIAAGAVEIAKILFFVFLIMFIVTLVMGIMRG